MTNIYLYKFPENKFPARRWLIFAVIGLISTATGLLVDPKQTYYSWLTAVLFWTSMGLGALFILMLNSLTSSVWNVVLRRIFEAIALTLPIMLILFLPILLGMGQLYHWSHPEVVAADELLQKKAGYLNPTFFTIRLFGYFAIWIALAFFLRKISLRQDQQQLSSSHYANPWVKISAPGMILYAITVSFAAFDWMMSLDPHWYSTIYGVGFFTGCVMGMFALTIWIVRYLNGQSLLTSEITVEHRHDLGKMMYVFLILWAYMAFSQYFLIWYANIPEETLFYHHRWDGSWKTMSLFLVFGHFVIPFFGLISRNSKRSPAVLAFFAMWLLVMHYFDLYWNIMPNLHHHAVHFSYLDLTSLVAVGGIFMWAMWNRLTAVPLLPINDPKLEASLKHVNTY